MFFDDLRNKYYSDAICSAVKKSSIVLDLGAGLGLHGFIAAMKGARKVYLVEPESIIDIANQLVKANNLTNRMECIHGNIEEVNLPKKVDIIISVFTGNFLLTEDLLPSLFYARDQYLLPQGKLIPDRAIMEVAPVSVPEHYAKHVDSWTNNIRGLDFSLVRRFAANTIYFDPHEKKDTEFLSDPVEILDLDFMTATDASCRSKIKVEISQNGLCHGWLGWFRIHVGDKWLSTSPKELQTHWRQAFLALEKPINVTKGDILSFELSRPEFGEWSWAVEYGDEYQNQSTFLSEPITPATLHKKSDNYMPLLSQKGTAIQDVLVRMNGNQTTETIVEYLLKEHYQLFPSRKRADRFVKSIVEQYA